MADAMLRGESLEIIELGNDNGDGLGFVRCGVDADVVNGRARAVD